MQVEEIKKTQHAILIGLLLPGQDVVEKQDHLEELAQLAGTAGLSVVYQTYQERDKIQPAFFIGTGKVMELQHILEESGSRIIIFDDDLAPAQIRNLEKYLNVKVIDRSTLILDIFAKHARTREAKTQVELAQLQYFLPRLTRQWTHLSRQVGGVGTRGPGETQLETDRRLVRRRIEKLRSDLKKIDKQQKIRRQQRQDIFRVCLVGYTNVGKSSIMNRLSQAGVLVENQLFATLDSIVRKVRLNGKHEILLSDTVGFIRKLPTHLVASFKSTLDEVREANLLLHVVDVHHPRFPEQMQTVRNILEQLEVHDKPTLIVFNKIDLLEDPSVLSSLRLKYPDSVFLSATRQIGLEAFQKKIAEVIEGNYCRMQIRVPLHQQKFIHYIYTVARVEKQAYQEEYVDLRLHCDRQTRSKIRALYDHLALEQNFEKMYEEIAP